MNLLKISIYRNLDPNGLDFLIVSKASTANSDLVRGCVYGACRDGWRIFFAHDSVFAI